MSHWQGSEFCFLGAELAAESSTSSSGWLAFIGTYTSGFSSLMLSYEFLVCWGGAFCTDSAPPLPKAEYATEEAKELEDSQVRV